MTLTEAAIRAIESARWQADPETEATLDYIVRTLTSPEPDGLSMIERTYRTCTYRNQRNAEVWAAGSAFLQKSFKNKAVYFAVDAPDEGNVTFHLAVSDSPRDLHSTPQAHRSWHLNLLREHADWILPPKSETRPVANATPAKPTGQPRAEPRKPTPQRPPARKI